jgi:hypothetical protein
MTPRGHELPVVSVWFQAWILKGKNVRGIAKVYAAVVAVLLTYAWYIDISMQTSQREHLLGDMLLSFAALPASLSVGFFYDHFRTVADQPFAELIWISCCASMQVVALFLLSSPVKSGRRGS